MNADKLKRIIRNLPERGLRITFLDSLVDFFYKFGLTEAAINCKRREVGLVCRRIEREKLDFSGEGVIAQNPCDTIWVCWWQGEDQMPPLVRVCYKSILKHCGNHNVVLLTKDNYSEYVDISPIILDKFSKGRMSVTNLSDVIRANILAKRGGLWLDAAIYVTKPVDDFWFSRPFTTIAMGWDQNSDFYIETWWSTFCMGRGIGKDEIFCRLVTFYNDYYSRYGSNLDYFLLDIALHHIYTHFPEAHEIIASHPLHTGATQFDLHKHLYDNYIEESFDVITMRCGFNKLSYKDLDYNLLMKDGTVYRHLAKLVGE